MKRVGLTWLDGLQADEPWQQRAARIADRSTYAATHRYVRRRVEGDASG